MKEVFFLLSVVLIFSCSYSQSSKDIYQANGIMVGAQAPNINVIDTDSAVFNLQEELKDSPVVLVFYRGFWCPYCNKHLNDLQDSLKLIEKMGARLVAISPQNPLDYETSKAEISFTLLFDAYNSIAKAYDVDFTPKPIQVKKYNFIGANLSASSSDEPAILPIPATYIINKDGVVIWRHFDPDYKKRSSVKDILDVLDKI